VDERLAFPCRSARAVSGSWPFRPVVNGDTVLDNGKYNRCRAFDWGDGGEGDEEFSERIAAVGGEGREKRRGRTRSAPMGIGATRPG